MINMAQAGVVVINETKLGKPGEWNLCFQYCRYEYGDDDNTEENGYRFIWRKPDGSLQGARGQARIPSISDIQYLTGKALAEGWGHYNNGNLGFEY
jgi:hypothetical protein